MIVTDKLSTESFHAFIDEQLTDEQYAQVEAQLDEIPEKIEEIQQCHIINERLREVFDPIVEEPIPDDLFELGLYGLDQSDNAGDDDFEERPVSYLELEEDIAAIDSLDIFTESEDGSFIDDTDPSDLELLAQTEHLSEFDIDNLRHDPENIIPDIFDDTGADSETYSDTTTNEYEPEPGATDSADELLETIDALSMELEKARESKQVQSDENESGLEPLSLEPESMESESYDDSSEHPLNETDDSGLELQSTDDEYDTDRLALLNESQLPADEPEDAIQQTAKDKVLDMLSTEEELTLEPLEEKSNDAFIQELELSAEEETRQFNKQQNKSVRPRNIRADQVVKDNHAEGGAKADGASSVSAKSSPATSFSGNDTFKQNFTSEEDLLPDDLVAEFFSENKGADFEVNEVVKHFDEVSGNFDDDNQLFDEGPLANIKIRAQEFVSEASARIGDIKTTFLRKKTELMGRFGGSRADMDFNETSFASFSTSKTTVSSTDTLEDTLDLSGFDDFINQSKPTARQADNSSQDLNQSGKAGTDFQQDINLDSFKVDSVTKSESVIGDQDSYLDIDNNQQVPTQPKGSKTEIPEITPAASHDFNMNFGFDDGPDENNLVTKIGDTLRRYKQKLAEMRAATAEGSENLADPATSEFEKYKNAALTFAGKLQLSSIPKSGIAVVVFGGLFLVGLVVYLGGGSGGAIDENQIEKLAIDTHLLNSQFNAKIAVDAESAIIEKLQWFSARIGRQVRLADIRVEDFEFKNVTVIPTMASFAATNTFENKAGQRITLLAIGDNDGAPEAAVSCKIPAEVDGLCSWVKGSVRYIAVANLSLSRVRSFSEQIVENL